MKGMGAGCDIGLKLIIDERKKYTPEKKVWKVETWENVFCFAV